MKTLTRTLYVLAAAVALLATSSGELSAQPQPIHHYSHELIDIARQYATESLPSDARLVLIGAVGNVEPTPGMSLTIDADSGTASAWAYIYYIESQSRWTAVAVVDIPFLGKQVYEMDPPTMIPPTLTKTLVLDDPYHRSGEMAKRLMLDPDYLDYRESYPDVLADVLSYSDPVVFDSLALPPSFPLDAPIWTVRFTGRGDSALVCWVSGGTGESYCLRGGASAVDEELSERAGAAVIPNPASATATVVLSSHVRSASDVGLFDATGARVGSALRLDHVDGATRALFDVSMFPAGMYYVGTAAEGAVARVVVVR